MVLGTKECLPKYLLTEWVPQAAQPCRVSILFTPHFGWQFPPGKPHLEHHKWAPCCRPATNMSILPSYHAKSINCRQAKNITYFLDAVIGMKILELLSKHHVYWNLYTQPVEDWCSRSTHEVSDRCDKSGGRRQSRCLNMTEMSGGQYRTKTGILGTVLIGWRCQNMQRP